MGKRGREIVGVDVKELIKDLNKAYADEWIAYFDYTWAADVASGINSPAVAGELDRIAAEELEHSEEIAARILELGGEPIRDFEKLQPTANCKKVIFPKDPSDLKGILKGAIEAERCAIDVYNNLLKKIKIGKDPVTVQVIRHIMTEEIAHEEAFESLL